MVFLITGAWKASPSELEAIRNLGHEIILQPQESEPLVCPYEKVEGVICNGLFLSHPIEKFTNLKYIQLTSAGYDRVPMDYVKAHGIEIRNARGVYSIPMAEHAIAGVLTLYRHLAEFHEFQKAHRWEKIRNLEELNGKNVLILGCGSVGTECARRFSAFNCHVIGVDVAQFPVDHAFQELHLLPELDALLPQAHILILTLPLTPETRGLISAQRLSLLKDQAVIVNLARGPVLDYDALTTELAHNRLRAVLDVFPIEPLPENSPLWNMPSAVVTPHNSFVGNGNFMRLSAVILNHIKGIM